MQLRTALGGFLAVAGVMVLVLEPVYEAGAPAPSTEVEAAAPLHEYRVVPGWLGAAAIGLGTVLLLAPLLGTRRR
jgi:hypothetical protein